MAAQTFAQLRDQNQNSTDAETMRNNALNQYLSDLQYQRNVRDQQLRGMTTAADAGEFQLQQAKGAEEDQAAMDRNLVQPSAPQVTTRTPGVNGGPESITMRPAQPMSARDRLLSSVPGHDLPKLQMALSEMDLKKRVADQADVKQAEVTRHDRAGEAAANPFGLNPQQAPGAAPMASGAPVQGAASGQGVTGEDFLKTLPIGLATQVKSYAEGRQQFPSGFALKSPYFQQMLQAVGQYDPTFDAIHFNARAKTRSDFTSGKAAGQVNAINTVIGHLHDLSNVGQGLGNTSMDWVNKIYNAVTPGGSTRGVAINNFVTLQQGVKTELMRTWRQVGAGSENEIKDWGKTIDEAKSPEELRGAFQTIGGMLESKLGALDSQYKQGMGTDKVTAISSDSRQKLDALQGMTGGAQGPSAQSGRGAAPRGGTVMLKAPDGSMRPVPADQVDHYLTLGAKRVGG